MLKSRTILPAFVFLLFFPIIAFTQELTATYLEGPWCYSHAVSGDDRQDENKNFLFDNNGTFSYQQSEYNDKLTPGFKYEILPEKLKLKPIFPGELKVKSIKQNEMVLNYFMDLYFIRGECS